MSELMNARNGSRDFRWQLLSTVSVLALLATVSGSGQSEAADQDTDRPTIWIELGGQLDSLSNSQETFTPSFMASITQANLLSAMNVQKPPTYALGLEGKISFQPDSSDWVFSASVRYGRSQAARHRHQQTQNPYVQVAPFTVGGKYINLGTKYPSNHVRFADGRANQSERHLVADFQAGKDVGLGMFGKSGSSILSAGVRFAQFNSKSNVSWRADPDVQYPNLTKPLDSPSSFRSQFKYVPVHFHDYAATANVQKSFNGVGPSVSWNASMPFIGDPHRGELTFDWGANAAVLFGRQKVKGHHQSTVRSYAGSRWHARGARNGNGEEQNGPHIVSGYFVTRSHNYGGLVHSSQTSADINRMRAVTIPNLGGSIGMSYRVEDFKVSLGYRADFFFGAMDNGIDTPKRTTTGFYGPFASVSVGLGG
jgi:iron complex outermembrane recepter protein